MMELFSSRRRCCCRFTREHTILNYCCCDLLPIQHHPKTRPFDGSTTGKLVQHQPAIISGGEEAIQWLVVKTVENIVVRAAKRNHKRREKIASETGR